MLLRSEEIRENEKKIFSWVQNGDSVREITAKVVTFKNQLILYGIYYI